MKNLKRICALGLAGVMTVSVAACGGGNKKDGGQLREKLKDRQISPASQTLSWGRSTRI